MLKYNSKLIQSITQVLIHCYAVSGRYYSLDTASGVLRPTLRVHRTGVTKNSTTFVRILIVFLKDQNYRHEIRAYLKTHCNKTTHMTSLQ